MNILDSVFNRGAGVSTSLFAGGSTFMSITLPAWIQIGSAIYLALLIVHQVYKMYKDWKGKDEPKE